MHQLTLGLKASQQHSSIATQRQIWTIADEGGFDSCWLFDHFVPMGRVREGDIFEAWTLLAAMAQATKRVRIGTLVTGNIYRHPGILAKMAATVDHLCAGRLTMGLGAGGDDYADRMLGLPSYPARERIEQLDEACQVLKLLWSEQAATFAGKHYQLEKAVSEPKPVQRPGPPLWIGSGGERYGMRVVAEHADVWVTAVLPRNTGDMAELTRVVGVLDRHCEDVGRDPATLRRAIQFPLPVDPEETIRAVERYLRAGFSDLILMPTEGGLARIEAAAALLPKLRTLG
jgi:alkanesulfonate monooxygenase SsuD/methylene tetrahydromethanopterin reductase-like flavin-dependent oxidoreductase (luciferase family)